VPSHPPADRARMLRMIVPPFQALHEEFCELFESICSGFLKQHGYTIEAFYEEVRQARERAEKHEEADEVVDVIYMVRASESC
jgi:hypothetical protein